MSIIKTLIKYLIPALILFVSQSVMGLQKYDSDFHWKTIETSHFMIHYHNGLEQLATEVASYAEKMEPEISDYFQWHPAQKTHLVVSDQHDVPNGFAIILPYNRIEIFSTPPSDINSLEDFDNWKEIVLKHEYVHIVQMDEASDFPLHMRNLLGRWPFLFPGQFMPSWIKEGIATYLETDNQKGVGRGQSSYFRGLMRNEYINGIKPLGMINQGPLDWPNGTTPYLYGVYFFQFLKSKYGDTAVQQFFDFYTSIPVPFFLNYSARRTLGVNFDTLWQQFESYLQDEFSLEIQQVKQEAFNAELLDQSGYKSGLSRVDEQGRIIYLVNDYEQPVAIKRYDPATGKTDNLYRFEPARLANVLNIDYHPDQGLLISMTDMTANSRQPADLYQLDLETLKLIRLSKEARYVRAVWSPDGNTIATVKVANGQHTLVLLSADGQLQSTLSEPGYDVLIGPMDWSPTSNQLVVSVFRPGAGWNLEFFDLENKQWTSLTNNQHIESDPTFDSQGQKIMFSADYDGIFNVYEYDLALREYHKLTNTLTVAFQPTYALDGNRFYFSQLTVNGFNLYTSDKSFQKSVAVENTLIPEQREATTHNTQNEYVAKDYNALRHLKPTWWFPILILSDFESSVGFITETVDPLFWHNYYAEIDYDIKNNNPGWLIFYTYKRFFPNFQVATKRETFHYPREEIEFQHETQSKLEIELSRIQNNFRLSATASYQYSVITQQYDVLPKDFEVSRYLKQVVASLSFDTRSFRNRAYLPYDGFLASAMIENDDIDSDQERNSRMTLKGQYRSPLLGINILEAEATLVLAGGLTEPLNVGDFFREPENQVTFTRRNYNLKGYKADTLSGTNMQRIQLSWNMLAMSPQTSFMIPPIGFSRLFFKTYFMAARVGNYSDINDQPWFKSIGSELQINSDFGYKQWPFAIVAGIAKGLEDVGELIPYAEIVLNF